MGGVENVLGCPDEKEFVDPETKMAAIWYYRVAQPAVQAQVAM